MSIKSPFTRTVKGAILTEAALLIPLLAFISFCILEFCNILYLMNTLNFISQYSSRYAAVNPNADYSEILNATHVNKLLPDSSNLTINISPSPGNSRSIGSKITTTLSYNYTPLINPFVFFNPGSSASVIPLKVSNSSLIEVK